MSPGWISDPRPWDANTEDYVPPGATTEWDYPSRYPVGKGPLTPNQRCAMYYALGKGDSAYMATLFADWVLPGDDVDAYAGDLPEWIAARYAEWVYEV